MLERDQPEQRKARQWQSNDQSADVIAVPALNKCRNDDDERGNGNSDKQKKHASRIRMITPQMTLISTISRH